MKITYSGQLTKKQFQKYFGLSYPNILMLIVTIVVLIILCFMLFNGAVLQGVDFTGLLVIIVPMALIIYIMYRQINIINGNKVNSKIFEEIHGEINNDGVEVNSVSTKTKIKWAEYVKFEQKKDLVLLSRKKTSNFFPRTFFSSDEDWQAFIDFAKSKINSKKK
jgi:preprotein translocase subunit SecF